MSKPEGYMERLAALNRKPLDNAPPTEAEVEDVRRKLRQRAAPVTRPTAPAIEYRRDAPWTPPRGAGRAPIPGNPVPLDEAIAGEEVEHAPWGRAMICRACAEDLGRQGVAVVELFRARAQTPSLVRGLADRCGAPVGPDDVVFVDLETAGLGSAPVFLVGLMGLEADRLVVRQYLARNYAEEGAITALFAQAMACRRVVVTFNGKTFDLPYMRARAAANGVPMALDHAHLDLLHESRRAWRGQVPDHKPQTLERWICGRFRQEDIPGAEVPEAYHAFVRTGDARDLARIVHHNRMDLLTLAELLLKIPDCHWVGEEA